MLSAFVGYLSPGETLLLWDRVVGFDSLLPLPVLAVAVLTFRWGRCRRTAIVGWDTVGVGLLFLSRHVRWSDSSSQSDV